MSSKSNLNRNRSLWCLMLPLLLPAFSGSWVSGCGTEADGNACPDTAATANDYQNLDSGWVWRICNTSSEYTMEDIEIYGQWNKEIDFTVLTPCECSSYYSSNEQPLYSMKFTYNEEDLRADYLGSLNPTSNSADSSSIWNTKGRYTYYFNYDHMGKEENKDYHIKIQIETYHE